MTVYPNDADGAALRRVARDGSDMRKPMSIDFQIASQSEQSTRQFAVAAEGLGYRVSVYGKKNAWTCECSTRMLVTYGSVIAIQQELAGLSKPFGAHPDGWGTFGNGPNAPPRK